VQDDDVADTVSDWCAFYDDEGRLYYYNTQTGQSSWEPPLEGYNHPTEQTSENDVLEQQLSVEEKHEDGVMAGQTAEIVVPESHEPRDIAEPEEIQYDWSAFYDDEGRLYYHNAKTGKSAWDPPEDGFNPPREIGTELPKDSEPRDGTEPIVKSPASWTVSESEVLEDTDMRNQDAAVGETLGDDGDGAVDSVEYYVKHASGPNVGVVEANESSDHKHMEYESIDEKSESPCNFAWTAF
jgi:hypothetical protein